MSSPADESHAGGFAASAIARGTVYRSARSGSFTLLRRRMMYFIPGARIHFMGVPSEIARVPGSEDLHFLVARVGLVGVGEGLGAVERARVRFRRRARAALGLEGALGVRPDRAVQVALQQCLRLVREERERLGRGAEHGLVQALELLARDVLELHRDD